MNRQYARDDFLRMIEEVRAAFDRPAITTDVIVGFPGETEDEFARTLDVVDRVKFVHVHAFSYSPRPRTAAARWTRDFVRGPVVNERIRILVERSHAHSFEFRREFIGQTAEVLVEHSSVDPAIRHGRCERYFDVHFEDESARPGESVKLVIERVTPQRTWGTRA
jgi:tRNA A37 methylthiotransferase MiaB